jgi:tetratricopeptide (TPR) repeat protein
MKQWKKNILAGNQLFDLQQYSEAANYYRQAKTCARDLLNNWNNAEEAIAAIVISQLNMADMHSHRQHFQQAEHELQNLHTYLLQALKENADGDREPAIRNGLRRSYTALLQFIAVHYSQEKSPIPTAQPWFTESTTKISSIN